MAQANYVTIPIRISIPGVGGKPSTSPAHVGPAEVIANLPRHQQPMSPSADLGDLDCRAAPWDCVTAVFNDTGAILNDLAADVIGAIWQTADGKVGRAG
jgi:hypothetical protein